MEQFQALLTNLEKLWYSEERLWFVSFRNPLEIWAENPTFLMLEVVTCVWACLLYKHGKQNKVGVGVGTGCVHALTLLEIYAFSIKTTPSQDRRGLGGVACLFHTLST